MKRDRISGAACWACWDALAMAGWRLAKSVGIDANAVRRKGVKGLRAELGREVRQAKQREDFAAVAVFALWVAMVMGEEA